ncbi:MAG: oligoendopeptidase F [Gammaproteobacteria bacterium]
MTLRITAAGLAVLASFAMTSAFGEEDPDRWDLTDLYPSMEAWQEAGKAVEARIPEIEACRGTLGDSAGQLESCLDISFDTFKAYARYSLYAGLLSDEDLSDQEAMARDQQASQLGVKLSRAGSYLNPELIQVGPEKIGTFVAQNGDLAEYAFYLENVLREAEHTLGQEAEGVMAAAGNVRRLPYQTYSTLTAAEIPWPTVTLSDGTEVRLDQAAYTRYRSVPGRDDRKKVFQSFFGTFKDYERTLGTTLSGQVQSAIFSAQVRDYDSALAAALSDDNIPESVYKTLLSETNANLDTLQRYLKLRARMLGLEDLGYEDMYVPIVSLDKSFPLAEGKDIMLTSMAPLGPEYTDVVKTGIADRWVDVYPRPSKRSGAYVNGAAYDVHPYMLLNYNDDYESVTTMAHEWGHAMHSYLASASQPYPLSRYAIFTAEVASTFNEALLLDNMLKRAKSDEERLYYLGFALEGIRTTFFRQTMFAEFELAIHEAAEAGEALTGAKLTEMYGDLLRRYYGADKGVTAIDDLDTIEWAYIPHFYYNFYVFQYATSIAASSLLAEGVMEGNEKALENYLDLLKAGGSDYAYELLKEAGVDMATPEPYRATFRRMNDIMDQIESILDKRGV